MPLFLCDREFVSDQRWRVDMNEFYEELKKVLDLSDGDVWTETVLCGKDAGKKRIRRFFNGSGRTTDTRRMCCPR